MTSPFRLQLDGGTLFIELQLDGGKNPVKLLLDGGILLNELKLDGVTNPIKYS